MNFFYVALSWYRIMRYYVRSLIFFGGNEVNLFLLVSYSKQPNVYIYIYIYLFIQLYCNNCLVCFQGLSGQPLSGPDIGGFAGNATPRLFGRWMGIGSMFPFCRGHSEIDTIDHEPWSFGKEVCHASAL